MKKYIVLILFIFVAACVSDPGRESDFPGDLLSISANGKFALVKLGYKKYSIINTETKKIKFKLPFKPTQFSRITKHLIFKKNRYVSILFDMQKGKTIIENTNERSQLSKDNIYYITYNTENTTVWDVSTAKKIQSFEGRFFALHGERAMIIIRKNKDNEKLYVLVDIKNKKEAAIVSGKLFRVKGLTDYVVIYSKQNTILWNKKDIQKRKTVPGIIVSAWDNVNTVITQKGDLLSMYSMKDWKLVNSFKGISGILSEDKKKIAVLIDSEEIEIKDIATKKVITTIEGRSLQLYQFSPNGKYLIVKKNRKLRIFETKTGEEIAVLGRSIVGGFPQKHIIFVNQRYNRRKTIWDLNTAKKIGTISSRIMSHKSIPGKYFVVNRGSISQWDQKTLEREHRFPGKFITFSPKGNYLITRGANFKSIIWDISKKRKLYEIDGRVFSFSLNEELFFVGKTGMSYVYKFSNIKQGKMLNLIFILISIAIVILIAIIINLKIRKNIKSNKEKALNKYQVQQEHKNNWWNNKEETAIPCEICSQEVVKHDGFVLSLEDAYKSQPFQNAMILTACELLEKPMAQLNRDKTLIILKVGIKNQKTDSTIFTCQNCANKFFYNEIYSGYKSHIVKLQPSFSKGENHG